MLKRSLSAILIFILIFSLWGCGSTKGADAQIVYPIDKDTGYLDPQIVYDTGSRNIIANCFEGLVRIDGEGKIIPAQAESWDVSSDGKTYTFHLRKDIKWTLTNSAKTVLGDAAEKFDTRVTAHDFVFGIKRALLPETVSPDAQSLYCIKNAREVHSGAFSPDKLGIKAKDDYTLVIKLKSAYPDFLYSLTNPGAMPCNEEFFRATGGRYGLAMKYLICNGPFYLYNWADDTSFVIRRSEDYYGKEAVLPKSVYFSVKDEQSTRLSKLMKDTYNVSPLTIQQAAELEGKKGYGVYSFDSAMNAFIFNCADQALSNIKIRQALVSALNSSDIMKNLSDEVTGNFIPDGLIVGGRKYGEARKTVEKYTNPSPMTLFNNGLEELEISTVNVTVLCTPENEKAIRTLMQSWQSILGVSLNVTVEAVDSDQLRRRISSGDYQLAYATAEFSRDTVEAALSQFTSYSKENFTNYKNSDFDKLVYSIMSASSVKQAVKLIWEAETHLVRNCVIFPVKAEKYNCATGKGVSGISFNASGKIIDFRNALAK